MIFADNWMKARGDVAVTVTAAVVVGIAVIGIAVVGIPVVTPFIINAALLITAPTHRA